MGLFDDYFDPQTFSGDSGGLLGRLQLQQGQYQPGPGFDLTPSVPQLPLTATPSVPQTPDSGQTQNIAIGGYQMPQFGRADVPQPVQQPVQQPPDLGDRLNAGFQNWAHTLVGNPMAAIANGITGFGSGQRTDQAQAGAVPPQTQSSTADLGDRLSAGFQNWAHTPVGNPMAAIANGITGLSSGQLTTDPSQISQAQVAALKSLLGVNQDATPAAADPQAGNPSIAQAPTRQPANGMAPGYAALPPGVVPRKTGINVPWKFKPNIIPWSIK
jgi:hypothetical protein